MSPLLKHLSYKYKDKLSFAELHFTDKLCRHFGVSKYPKLIVLTHENQGWYFYDGELKLD